MANIQFEILKELGVLSESSSGWKKELNLISWNNREPKYDLRDWGPNHEKMGKGITFTAEELSNLKELFNKIDMN
ncbi:YdbC family protein [Amphibacillus jilinensis]|uniref:YdbC family protein n=1 Tax=Amphibacillus jilinensis TaxID=1216008 RepID=UPI0002F3378D|nr:PC4/YdbC family ssDNA-binding protein [Amphibacillus jilinensis]